MNRRSFLQLLGLAPIAPTVIAAMPEPTPAIKLAFPHPWLPPDTLPVSEFARQEIERITGIDAYGRSPLTDLRYIKMESEESGGGGALSINSHKYIVQWPHKQGLP